MISRVDLWNLKGFDGAHAIDLAPITLVYGPNSSGKSSLLHALALFKQTLEPLDARLDVETPALALRGDLIDLGNFGAAIHRHDRTRELGVGLQVVNRPQPIGTRSGKARARRDDLSVYAAVRFGYDGRRRAVVQREAALGIADSMVRFKAVPSSKVPTAIDDRFARSVAPVAHFALRNKTSAREAAALLDYVDVALRPKGARRRADTPAANFGREQILSADPPLFAGRGFFPSTPLVHSGSEEDRELSFGARTLYSDLFSWIARRVDRELRQLAYLGPLREAPKRFQQLSSEVQTTVGSRGEHTSMLLRRDPRLVKDVNHWLQRLGIRYKLAVDAVTTEATGIEIGDLLTTRLVDERSGVAVTPQDVGFGISQLLPVVVQLLARRGGVVCVEQPEIHIHPKLQAEFGDLLFEAARRGTQVIVETHSEHLMLRIQRRLREGDAPVPASQVSVLYVDVDNAGAANAQRLALSEQGRFLDEWPNGFFAERLVEIFGGARGAGAFDQ